ncbi:hypothetical protein BT63DRAFT_113389 [Microthyrium microscopicum]|uniref:Heterokaryon incompatibility domain-containing protein n=1 Tax=Microthyrium microscopicum TaxID=703497 RepID=A0A6A6TXF5_9PEZI|nr:hypothetical protein BT63DRAFT_113389 [Microthyrium microscopicum]
MFPRLFGDSGFRGPFFLLHGIFFVDNIFISALSQYPRHYYGLSRCLQQFKPSSTNIFYSQFGCSLFCLQKQLQLKYSQKTQSRLDSTFLFKINKQDLAVRHNLLLALQRLRLPHEERTIWIDAVCINQNCVPERNYIVVFMRDIYTSAKGGVVVWFGEDEADTHLVHSFLERVIEGCLNKEKEEKGILRHFKKHSAVYHRVPLITGVGYRALYNLPITPWSCRI